MVTLSRLLCRRVLNVALEHEKEVEGIPIGKEAKVSLFAGDTTVYANRKFLTS